MAKILGKMDQDGRTTVRAGHNRYYCISCAAVFEDEQAETCPKCKARGAAQPLYPASRIDGDKYRPYQGNDTWSNFANVCMRETAHENFLRSQRRGR